MTDQPSPDRVVALLRDALNGDASQIDELRLASQEQLHAAGQTLGGHLTFGRSALVRVIQDWRTGRLTDEQVRWWARLMFAGAFPEYWSPYGSYTHFSSQPIDIDYSSDERVNEIVFRLKDLGDFDDYGQIAADRDNMIRELAEDS